MNCLEPGQILIYIDAEIYLVINLVKEYSTHERPVYCTLLLDSTSLLWAPRIGQFVYLTYESLDMNGCWEILG